MKRKAIFLTLVMGLFFFGVSADQVFAARQGSPKELFSCIELTSLRLPNARILSADKMDDHCVARGVIEKEINFEALLPDDWNGKFLMGGGGGFVGSIQNQAQDPRLMHNGFALERGYATVGTDTGHTGAHGIDGSWALNNMKRKLNFGFRAVHLTAKTTKRIIHAYYGSPPLYSYFFGCSRGGGQAMIESQRYPKDFDGIIAGAPAYNWTGFGMGFVWNQQGMYPDPFDPDDFVPPPTVTNDKLPLLDAAILSKCDDIDGLEDGLINDPRNCDFDPAVDCLDCALTPMQVAAIQRVYDGPSNSRGQIFPGFPPGAESSFLGWDFWIADGRAILQAIYGIDYFPNAQYGFGQDIMRYFVYDDPEYEIQDFDFETDIRDTARAAAILNGTNPNLRPFKVHGGKMIIFNGWADHAITALGAVQYYEQVLDRMGERNKVESFLRLFLVPGMLHCFGGPGPNEADWLSALEEWVEDGIPPDRITAYGGEIVDRTRPLCPYPLVAEYDESCGDPNDADCFECQEP
jgi:feruloyl esterase